MEAVTVATAAVFDACLEPDPVAPVVALTVAVALREVDPVAVAVVDAETAAVPLAAFVPVAVAVDISVTAAVPVRASAASEGWEMILWLARPAAGGLGAVKCWLLSGLYRLPLP